MDQTETLPDDALANILRRLPPCDLAASRCVRKAWRAVVDAHRLLLPHVLPHSVRGIFLNYIDYEQPHFFARPSTRPVIDGNLDFLPGYTRDFEPIVDHCNGILIYGSGREPCVVNPATRRWERLPQIDADSCNKYLVFDPAVSPHYRVLLVPDVPTKPTMPRNPGEFSTRLASSPIEQEDPHDLMEWPPSSWTLDVFSSCTRQW